MENRKQYTPIAVPLVETRFRRIHTRLPVPESLPLLRKMVEFEPSSMQGQPPLIWDRAEGFQVYDPFGNMWLDWSSGVLVANIGHSDCDVIEAICEQVKERSLFSYCFPTESRIMLAQRLVEITPPGLDKAFILTTGSETTECAIKLARTYGRGIDKKKVNIVSFENGFHGRTLGAQMAGGFPQAKEWIGNLDLGFIQVPFPDGFRCTSTEFKSFEESLSVQNIDPDTVAGVMMESYQGGGASFAPAHYVKKLKEWCEKHQSLLILDEVQAGFGRTGKLFAFEHYGVIPDILCLGKGISGSLPVAAVVGAKGLMDLYGPGSMTSTHGGNPVCCAAALKNIDKLISGKIVERSSEIGRILERGLREIHSENKEIIGDVQGKGMVYALHITQADSRFPDGERASSIQRRCFEAGLLLFAPVGLGGANVKICPPLTISREAVEEGLSVLKEAVATDLRENPPPDLGEQK
jgi:4-aminobutyrate aminotransferase/(S)-3-amino-2-methylpropionate transaminase